MTCDSSVPSLEEEPRDNANYTSVSSFSIALPPTGVTMRTPINPNNDTAVSDGLDVATTKFKEKFHGS